MNAVPRDAGTDLQRPTPTGGTSHLQISRCPLGFLPPQNGPLEILRALLRKGGVGLHHGGERGDDCSPRHYPRKDTLLCR